MPTHVLTIYDSDGEELSRQDIGDLQAAGNTFIKLLMDDYDAVYTMEFSQEGLGPYFITRRKSNGMPVYISIRPFDIHFSKVLLESQYQLSDIPKWKGANDVFKMSRLHAREFMRKIAQYHNLLDVSKNEQSDVAQSRVLMEQAHKAASELYQALCLLEKHVIESNADSIQDIYDRHKKRKE